MPISLRDRLWRFLHQIQRALYPFKIPSGYVQIDGRCLDAAVAQKLLDMEQIHAGIKQMRGKAVPEGVDGRWLVDLRFLLRLCEGLGHSVGDHR